MATAKERNFQVQDCRNEVASDDCCFHSFTRRACVIQLSHFTARQRETGTSAIFPKAIRGAAAEPGLNPASFGEHVEILNKTITTVPSYSRKKGTVDPVEGLESGAAHDTATGKHAACLRFLPPSRAGFLLKKRGREKFLHIALAAPWPRGVGRRISLEERAAGCHPKPRGKRHHVISVPSCVSVTL